MLRQPLAGTRDRYDVPCDQLGPRAKPREHGGAAPHRSIGQEARSSEFPGAWEVSGVEGRRSGTGVLRGCGCLRPLLEQDPCGNRWVRHEALCNRERMKGPLRGSVAADR